MRTRVVSISPTLPNDFEIMVAQGNNVASGQAVVHKNAFGFVNKIDMCH